MTVIMKKAGRGCLPGGYDEGYDAGKLAGEYDRGRAVPATGAMPLPAMMLIDYYDLDLESKSYRDNFWRATKPV